MQIHSPQSPITLDNVELVIEGDIENDQYISTAMEAIEKYENVSILLYFYFYIEHLVIYNI